MKAIVITTAVLFLLTSCGMNRHVVKSDLRTSDAVSQQTVTDTHKEDKTVTTVKETLPDTIITPGVKVQSESAGIKTTTVVNGDTLTAVYDPEKKSIKAAFSSPEKKIVTHKQKETKVESNIVETVKTKTDSTSQKTFQQSNVDKTVKISWVWAYIVGGILVLVVLYFINRKFKFLEFTFGK